MIGVYTITENETGKVYVGQSIWIDDRWKKHQKTKPLTAYTYKVEQECCIGLLDVMERYFIKKFNTLTPSGLNRTKGGNGTFGFYNKERLEKRKLQTPPNKGKTFSDEWKINLSLSHQRPTRPTSEETKQKISQAKTGTNYKPHSEEARLKKSETSKKMWAERRKRVL
jgi:hypothetical protein